MQNARFGLIIQAKDATWNLLAQRCAKKTELKWVEDIDEQEVQEDRPERHLEA